MELVLGWLLEQTPVMVVMGLVIYWLQNRLKTVEDKKEELTKDFTASLNALESLHKKLGEDGKEDATTKQLMLQKLTEIKTIVSTILYNENNRK
jgi:hypothetical protein